MDYFFLFQIHRFGSITILNLVNLEFFTADSDSVMRKHLEKVYKTNRIKLFTLGLE